jgi:hypothetical protein
VGLHCFPHLSSKCEAGGVGLRSGPQITFAPTTVCAGTVSVRSTCIRWCVATAEVNVREAPKSGVPGELSPAAPGVPPRSHLASLGDLSDVDRQGFAAGRDLGVTLAELAEELAVDLDALDLEAGLGSTGETDPPSLP